MPKFIKKRKKKNKRKTINDARYYPSVLTYFCRHHISSYFIHNNKQSLKYAHNLKCYNYIDNLYHPSYKYW